MIVLSDEQAEEIRRDVHTVRGIVHRVGFLDITNYTQAIAALDKIELTVPKEQDTRQAWRANE